MKPALLALIIMLFTSACVEHASTQAPFTGQNPFTPEAAAHRCTAANLQTSASANEQAEFVIIGVTLTNRSESPCNLQTPPQVQLMAGKFVDVEIVQVQLDAAPRSLVPGEGVILAVGWHNYCGEKLKTTPALALALTKSETLTITPTLQAPPCVDAKQPSTLTVNPYSSPP